MAKRRNRRKIPTGSKLDLARRAGAEPDATPAATECHYCGTAGTITWWPPGTYQRFTGRWTGGMFSDDSQPIYEPAPGNWITSTLEFDHVTSVHHGGDDRPENLVLACQTCNVSKGPRSVSEWVELLGTKRSKHPRKALVLARFGGV